MHAIAVLIVEDECLLRMDISDQLQDMGFMVLEARDAAEAVSILCSDKSIQIVFTDVDMPGKMDGLMLAAAVSERWPEMRIIITSGHRRVTLSDIPVDSRFIPKPYQAGAVASVMREMTA